MRIVHINMTDAGSTGKIMFGIAEESRKAGNEAWSFSPCVFKRGRKHTKLKFEHHKYFGSQTESMFHHYVAKLTGLQGYFSWFGTIELIKNLKKINPDIIHLHNLHNRTICVPLLFKYLKKSKVKVVWTLHDCWSFTGQCPHFVMAKCDKWMNGCHHCTQIHGYPDALVDRTRFMWKKKKKWFTGLLDAVLVTPSQWLAELAKQSFLNEYPVCTINNGIDLDVFCPTQSDFIEKHNLQDKFVLLGVAFGWGKRKGLDVFIRLAKELDNKYRIVLVGTDEQVEKQLPDNIISIRRTQNQKELAQIYTAADLFVNPTREDNYPTVNIEAIACGTPIITFRTGGSPECIDETCGTVVECDDVEGMKTEICRICSENLFKKEDCIIRANSFDFRNKNKEYLKLYENSTHSTQCTV